MTYVQGACSYRLAAEEDSMSRFIVGRVLVLNNPPASTHLGVMPYRKGNARSLSMLCFRNLSPPTPATPASLAGPHLDISKA
jgi:hypothetical protein